MSDVFGRIDIGGMVALAVRGDRSRRDGEKSG